MHARKENTMNAKTDKTTRWMPDEVAARLGEALARIRAAADDAEYHAKLAQRWHTSGMSPNHVCQELVKAEAAAERVAALVKTVREQVWR
jgi:hypothetical protein